MSLYDAYETDPQLEVDGVPVNYGKNSKGQDMLIKVARAGGRNSAHQKRANAIYKPVRRQLQNETIDEDLLMSLTRKLYAETVVKGWEGLEDKQGNALPFSVENCIKLFEELPDIFLDIKKLADEMQIFRVAAVEDDAKN